MARIAQAAGLIICLQAAAGLAGALGTGWTRWAGGLSVLDRLSALDGLQWLGGYLVFANASLLVAGIAVLVAATRIRGG
ncbi:hypothetical protein GCM10027570_37800 [Streptomonospora sediminis]